MVGRKWESIQPFTLASYAPSVFKSLEEKLKQQDPIAYIKNPKQLLIDAAKDNREVGSSTFVVVSLDPDCPKLRAAMIGDSGFMILRPGVVPESDSTKLQGKSAAADPTADLSLVFKSEEQQHSFNFPFQIGTNGDSPQVAIATEHDIRSDDIIILGTDGLLDNLFSENILEITREHLQTGRFDSGQLASKIAESAFKKSLDTQWQSPFAVGARKSGYFYRGGKSDDITVVVGRVELKD